MLGFPFSSLVSIGLELLMQIFKMILSNLHLFYIILQLSFSV